MSEISLARDDHFVESRPGNTICELIFIQLQIIYEMQSHVDYEDEIIRLANILLPNTKSYAIYFLALYCALEDLNYGLALQAGRLMLQHERLLHAILDLQSPPQSAILN